ncbi:MAG: glycoside hydrolase N-terminal domain-containing protein [Bacteroidaceae bacterium]|nr:glycoside hydrolase N-terminal domain-containing protein [Bacteroidaceae bacterium]
MKRLIPFVLLTLMSLAGWADVTTEGTHYVTFTGKATDGRNNCLYNDVTQADGYTLQAASQPTPVTNAYIWRVDVSGSKFTNMKNGQGQSYGMKIKCKDSSPTTSEITFEAHSGSYYLKPTATGMTSGHNCLNVSKSGFSNAAGTPCVTSWSTTGGGANANDNHWDVAEVSGMDFYTVTITGAGDDAYIDCKGQKALSTGFIAVTTGSSIAQSDVTSGSSRYKVKSVSVNSSAKTINVVMEGQAVVYTVYSGGVPAGAVISIGGVEVKPEGDGPWTEGATYSCAKGTLSVSDISVTDPGDGYVWTIRVDNNNKQVWIDFNQLFAPAASTSAIAGANTYFIKDALGRYPYLKGSDLWHTKSASEACKFVFISGTTKGEYYIYDTVSKNYIYYTATTGSTQNTTAQSSVKYQSSVPTNGGLWKFNADGNIIPATGSDYGWNFTGGDGHPLNLWKTDDSNCKWTIVDSSLGSLACAVTMFSKPNTEYMHKIVTEGGVTVTGIELSDELKAVGCNFSIKDRSTLGNKYKYVHGTAPAKEGTYYYYVTLSDGTKAKVSLTVSNFLQAATPGMVWVSWNWLQDKITAANLTDMAKGLVDKGLVKAGYNTMVIDDAWGTKTGVASLTWNSSKFPQGMPDFVKSINDLGVKVGIYSDAATYTCGGYQNGSIGYEEQHAQMFDEWGIDFLKYDFCGGSNAPVSYKKMGDAIAKVNAKRQASGNPDPFVFNACEWGTNQPWTWGAEAGTSMWRATQDAREEWCGTHGRPAELARADEVRALCRRAGVTRFDDLDMMTIGLHGLGGPSNNTSTHMSNGGKITGLTDEQARSQMSIWSMMASPLSLSCDVRQTPANECNPSGGVLNPMLSAADLATLTNADIISISQDVLGQQAEYMKELSADTYQQPQGYSVFVKDLAGGKKALAMVNRGGTTLQGKTFTMENVYLTAGTYYIKDVWAGTVQQAGSIVTGSLKPYETKVFIISSTPLEGTEVDPSTDVTISYNLKWNGVTKKTITTTVAKGSPFPAVSELPFGVEATAPTGQATADASYDVVCSLSDSYPVKVADSFAELTDATFYVLEQNPADTDGFWTYNASATPNVKANAKETPNEDTMSSKAWGFVGNPFDGYKIYNRAAGATMTLNKSGVPYVMKTDNSNNLWTIEKGTRSGFFISPEAGKYINLQSGQLKNWTSADGGSTTKATSVAAYAPAPTGEYATFEAGSRPAGVSDYTLWYNVPGTKESASDKWMDYGLCVGNGKVGAVVLGGVKNDAIQFNEKTLWAGGIASRAHNAGYGSYQNFGSLIVSDLSGDFSSAPVKNYNRYLDIVNGVSGVNYSGAATNYTRTYITSAPDNVFAARYTATGDKKLNLLFAYYPDTQINASEPVYTDGTGSFSGALEVVQYNAQFKVVTDGTVTTTEAGVKVGGNATYAVVYMAAGTTFDLSKTTLSTGDKNTVAADNAKAISAAIAKGWDKVYADHVANFSALMNRVSLTLGNASSTKDTKSLINAYQSNSTGADGLFLENLYYQFGRYLTIATNNINTIGAPSNLQGIWNNRSNTPFWFSDIHADINVQMNYWPVEAGNLSEMHKPFLDHIINLSKEGYFWRQLAKSTMGSNTRGWQVSTENNIFGGVSNWMLSNMKTHNGWYVSHLWNHYRYTLDYDFLKEAFPAMYGAAQYLMDVSTAISSKDGKKEIPNEWSPEHGASSGFNSTFVTAYAQQNAAECITEVLEAAEVLGKDAGLTDAQIKELRDFYASMDLGLNTEQYNGKTCLSEWKYKTLNHANDCASHRHLSHLMALYPYNQVSAFATDKADKDLYEAAKNSLAARSSDDVTGWSMGWKVNCLARTLEGNEAHRFLAKALKHSDAYDIQMSGKGGMYYNMWDAHSPFQIDGNFGVCAGVNEMLLQSYDNVLHILPALPTVWGDGKVSGLKAIGNFTVGIDWKNGKAISITVESHKGSELIVDCKDIDLSVSKIYVDGVEKQVTKVGNYYSVPCEEGSSVFFSVDGKTIPTGIKTITAHQANVMYDLTGRRISAAPTRGISLRAGRKILN